MPRGVRDTAPSSARGRGAKHGAAGHAPVSTPRHSSRVRRLPVEEVKENVPRNLQPHNESPPREESGLLKDAYGDDQGGYDIDLVDDEEYPEEEYPEEKYPEENEIPNRSTVDAGRRQPHINAGADRQIPQSTPTADKVTTLISLIKAVKDLQWPRNGTTAASADKLHLFLRQFEGRVRMCGGSLDQTTDLLGEVLKGSALSWYLGQDRSSLTWADLKVNMMRRFQPARPYEVVLKLLQSCKKLPSETYAAHLDRFVEITEGYSDPRSPAFPLGQQISLYINNLPLEVGEKIRDSYRTRLEVTCGVPGQEPSGVQDWPTLGQIRDWADAIDHELKERVKTRMQQPTAANPLFGQQPARTNDLFASLPSPGAGYRGKRFNTGFQANKRPKLAYMPSFVPSSPTSDIRSPFVGNPQRLGDPTPTGPSSVPAQPLGPQPIVSDLRRFPQPCWNCGQPGHSRAHCPLPPRPVGPTQPL
jgi:hypothetical protein